jgi:hypothetical protein
MSMLAESIRVRRRYSRSVNLERDLLSAEALEGYVLTPRAAETAARVVDAASPGTAGRAWTLTGTYGAGKSSFGHFLAAAFAPADDPMRDLALRLAEQAGFGELAGRLRSGVPDAGFVRAVATGRREPLAHTVVRGLAPAAERFWTNRKGPRPGALKRLQGLRAVMDAGGRLEVPELPELVREIAQASRTGVLIILDELGKVFEAAARSEGLDDLYLLQQLAELPGGPDDPPVMVLGLLHQAFAEYADGLATVWRVEWEKVHGRFEDVAFAEAPAQMIRLMTEAIESAPDPELAVRVRAHAERWHAHLQVTEPALADLLGAERIASLVPLHPVAAAVLPQLCARYAQNERSLFTFLASPEPHSFARFVADTPADADPLPLLGVADLYDYYVDIAGIGLYSRPQFQRWAEIHGLIRDAADGDPEELRVLKTIGTLNLLTSVGAYRAGRCLVLAALADDPTDAAAERWAVVLDRLVASGTVTYRERIDELRVWEGSHHDVGALVRQRIETDRRSLAELLSDAAPAPPAVAQRESYRTGALRYFERQYHETAETLTVIAPAAADIDGVIVHWVGASIPPAAEIPARTPDGRPIVFLPARSLAALEATARESAALAALDADRSSVQTDGVARREIRQRLALARRALDDAVRTTFTPGPDAPYWVLGERRSDPFLSAALSEACRRAYPDAPVVWNELLNRRELTAQGARARRILIGAILEKSDQPLLGLSGNGPEVSMYHALLDRTGIHREDESGWGFGAPMQESIASLWEAVEEFCLGATSGPRTIAELYDLLQAPPYGAKAGVIPVILAAVLVRHADDVSVYRTGSFLPILGPEHFEVLVKSPKEFSVRHFLIAGLRLEVFHELKTILHGQAKPLPREIRNSTVLAVARPLTVFARKLPPVTGATRHVSEAAREVRSALLNVTSPESLLFEELPRALGFEPFGVGSAEQPGEEEGFRRALIGAIRELHLHYERLLDECLDRIHTAFGCPGTVEQTREDLRVRARALFGRVIEPRLAAVVGALVDARSEDRAWLEAVVMIVADRPADTWTDNDSLAFELNLSDLAQRFRTLHAMHTDALAEQRQGFDARKVLITEPTGFVVHDTVWIEPDQAALVEGRAEEIAGQLASLPEPVRRAIAVLLAERILGRPRNSSEVPGPNEVRMDIARRQHG